MGRPPVRSSKISVGQRRLVPDRFDSLLFSSILNARAKLIDENASLAKQNDELRLLLSKYMQSKVNQELQIPPSQIIQLQLAEQSSGSGSAVY